MGDRSGAPASVSDDMAAEVGGDGWRMDSGLFDGEAP